MKRFAVLVLVGIAAGNGASAEDDIYTRFFTGADGGKPCYARYYDEPHLKTHPKQTVRRIEVDFDGSKPQDSGTPQSAASFEGGIGFMLKRSKEWYGQALYCKTAGERFDCYLDADGGRITLIPQSDALRLEVTGGGGGTDRIAVEGGRDFGTFGGPGSDDRVFILPRSPRKLCDAP